MKKLSIPFVIIERGNKRKEMECSLKVFPMSTLLEVEDIKYIQLLMDKGYEVKLISITTHYIVDSDFIIDLHSHEVYKKCDEIDMKNNLINRYFLSISKKV